VNPKFVGMASEKIERTAIEMNNEDTNLREHSSPPPPSQKSSKTQNLGITERSFSAAGAAFFSVIIANPLDVAKVPFNFILTQRNLSYIVFSLSFLLPNH